ncbi:MAG: DUF1302 family protein [Myxococcales bacterium]|jgi:hypothetical protein
MVGRRLTLVLTFALAASWTLPALADDEGGLRFGGHIKGFAFQQIHTPSELDRFGSRLQLNARGGDGEPARFFAAVDFEIDSRLTDAAGERRGTRLDVYPVEMYLALSKGPVDLKLGQQFIFWGRTTWVNPTDVITAWDYPNMASEIEDYRVAPVAARLNWYVFDELMLDLVWLPRFSPHRLGASAPGTMAGLPVTEGEPASPRATPENGEFGLRLSHTVSSWAFDWALSAYKGFEKMPVYTVEPIMDMTSMPPAPTGFLWRRRHDPLLVFGGDFSKAFGSFVLKGEGAWKRTHDRDGTDPNVRNSRLEYVLGLDYVFSEDFDVGVQYIGKLYLQYDEAAERAELARRYGGMAPPFVERRRSDEASLRLNLALTGSLGAQILGLYNFSYEDFFALGFVWWEPADALKLYVGAVAFGGSEPMTPLAMQEGNSRVFVEVKYSF